MKQLQLEWTYNSTLRPSMNKFTTRIHELTLNQLTWKIWWAPNNAIRWHMGFNSAFKGLMVDCFPHKSYILQTNSPCHRLRDLRRGCTVTRLLGLRVRIPPRTWMSVCCECCVLSGRCLCDRPKTHPEESYRVRCVWVWSRNLNNEKA